MIITCPHCQTKYQVTFEAIGSAGRKVQCAHCHQAWNQDPNPGPGAPPTSDRAEDDKLFDAIAEDALDEAMAAEESAVAVEAGRPAGDITPARDKSGKTRPGKAKPGSEAAELQKRQMAFDRRQNAMISSLPLARLRRAARIAGIVILAGLMGGAYFGRVAIVERYPDLAGVYEAVGLGVNVVGLDFTNLETLKALSGGNDVLTVSAQIVGRSTNPVPVPPVVISLLDADGHAVYEWSVSPRVNNLMAGERATFDTRLSLPPSEAVRVRLSFAGRGASMGERVGGASGSQTPEAGLTEGAGASAGDARATPAAPSHAQPEADAHAPPAPDNHPAEPDHAPAPAAEHH